MFGLLVGLTMQTSGWTAQWITTPTAKSPLVEAKWIWRGAATAKDAPVGEAWFRKKFDLGAVNSAASLRVTADNSAEVWLNGKSVGKAEDWSKVNRFAVGRLLRKGTNEILVKAVNGVGPVGGNPGGLILALESGETVVRTDASWQAAASRDFIGALTATVVGPSDTDPWHLNDQDLTPPDMRKEFTLGAGVRKAVVKVIGLGDYELRLNGRVVGNSVMNQAWSQFDKALYWREFDVTELLKKGENAFGVTLGSSFWYVVNPGPGRYYKGDMVTFFGKDAPFLLRLQCDVELVDGRHVRLGTDQSWAWRPSALTYSHVYGGENYDARREQSGWDRAEFAGKGWNRVALAPDPKVELRRQNWPGITVHEKFKPVKWIKREPGRWSVDFGQNCSGMVRMKLRGKAGQEVVATPSEVMTEAGEVQQLNLWGAHAFCSYILNGLGVEDWRWKFWYHGFRYVDVLGAVPAGKPNTKGFPVIESIELDHIRANNPTAGEFECSSQLFEKTHSLIDWAMRSNMMQVMSDCPHREKAGWLECSYLLARTFSYRYDCGAWLRKIEADIRDAQLPSGQICTVAPMVLQRPPTDAFAYTVEWGAAGVFLPWHLYEWYGDRATLEASYSSMKRFTDSVGTLAKDYIAPAGLGDWYDYGHGKGPGPSRFTPQDLSSTATYAMCVRTLIDSAKVLGHPEDVAKYEALFGKIQEAFLAKFYDASKKTLTNHGSPQAGHAMALEAGLIPEGDRAAVLQGILDDLEKRGYQQTPGDIGHLYFIRALAHAGRSDVLHKVYSRTGLGSYGGILAKGLTTLPETWDAITVGSNSLNHCMLGHAMEWFYGWVLGIRQADRSVAWARTLVAPEIGELTSAKGKVTTPHGEISVEWTRKGDNFEMTVSVPKGVKAILTLPWSGETKLDGRMAETKAGPFGRPAYEVGEGTWKVSCRR
ncbi:MAG: hypothetical protein BGO01_02720 [Armatimonadetes bacterium 55-13]|nr:family 78 glycoside hydrolase catalytic domain [Armatimonadota bacterium]OJU63580.1 MAG: hypothetical protein BGO01_02720 [Armatimonadetes bacterium 55-13]